MINRIINIIKEVNKLDGRIPEHLIDSMFETHNELFPDLKEYNKGCSKCRSRTFGRIQEYYNREIL